MKQIPVKLGPLALLLTVISICLTTLAILTFTTADADRRLAEKDADTVSGRHGLAMQGQKYLRELDELFAQGGGEDLLDFEADRDGVVWKTLELNGARLRIGITSDGGDSYRVTAWRHEKEWSQDPVIGNLWAGF